MLSKRDLMRDLIQIQKDMACEIAEALSQVGDLLMDEDGYIDYVTILSALADCQLKLVAAEGEDNIAGEALKDAIENDYTRPVRPLGTWNIYTTWIQKRLNASKERAIVLHDYIDNNQLINWDEMNCLEWTSEMEGNFNLAIEIADTNVIEEV